METIFHSIAQLSNTMKWWLISCTLIFLSAGPVLAESDEDQNDECYQKWRIQYELEQSCKEQQYLKFNETMLEEQFNTSVLHYSGDNAAVQSMANKYCPIFDQILDCSLIGNNLDDECQDPLVKQHDEQEHDISKELLNYLCEDSGAAILEILQNNGLETVYKNNQFNQCMKLVFGEAEVTVEKVGPKIITCDGVNNAFDCYIDYTRDHVNYELLILANEVRLVIRQALQCASENEL